MENILTHARTHACKHARTHARTHAHTHTHKHTQIFIFAGATRLSTVIPDSFVESMEGKPHGINLVIPKEVADLIVKFQNMPIANKETTRTTVVKAQPSDAFWENSENYNHREKS